MLKLESEHEARAQDTVASAHEEGSTDSRARGGSAVTVKPVVNAIRILRYLSQTGAPERAVDIARHLSINPSTCFNILRTLVAEDVVDFNSLYKTYSAGLGLARLVEQLVTQGQRVERAAPLMQEFAARHRVTTTLWRRMGTDRIVLVSSETSPTDLRIDMPAGQRLPILMGASGRLFAAQMNLDEEQMRTEFEQIRWSRPLTFEAYWREVQRGRRRGWTIDDGHFSAGIVAVAAPVKDASGAIAFAVSAVMFRGQYDDEALEALGEELRQLGVELSSALF